MVASKYLQNFLDGLQIQLARWRIEVNEKESLHVTFTMRRQDSPGVYLNCKLISSTNVDKYFGIHQDFKLTRKRIIQAKRHQLKLKVKNMYWLLYRKYNLYCSSEMASYKFVLK